MKRALFIVMVALNCIAINGQSSNVSAEKNVNWNDSIAYYTEQARWGNPEAYLQLAHCYHQGEKNVERCFYKMGEAGTMAQNFGLIENSNDVFTSLPDDDPIKVVYDVMHLLQMRDYEGILSNLHKLEDVGFPKQLAEAFVAWHKGEKQEAINILQLIAEDSYIANITVPLFTGDSMNEDVAEEFPFVYNELARDSFVSESSPEEDEKAAMYYRKADAHAALDKTGVRWLISYYEKLSEKGLQDIDPKEIERLKKLDRLMKE